MRELLLKMAGGEQSPPRAKAGGQGTKAVGRDGCSRHMTMNKIKEQRRNQRSMNDEARIALDRRHIGSVIMDAMTIEGER